MRKLRVVFTTVGGAMPALLAVMLTPAVDACGGGAAFESVDTSGEDASRGDAPISSFEAGPPPSPPPTDPGCPSYIVDIPPAGTPAEPGLLCAVPSPVASNVSARVTLLAYSKADLSAIGEITVPPDIEEAIVGLPTVTVRDASHAELSAMVVTEMTKATNGFRFKVTGRSASRTSRTGSTARG